MMDNSNQSLKRGGRKRTSQDRDGPPYSKMAGSQPDYRPPSHPLNPSVEWVPTASDPDHTASLSDPDSGVEEYSVPCLSPNSEDDHSVSSHKSSGSGVRNKQTYAPPSPKYDLGRYREEKTHTHTTSSSSSVNVATIAILDSWDATKIKNLRDALVTYESQGTHVNRYSYISNTVKSKFELRFRASSDESLHSHRKLSNADFFEALLRFIYNENKSSGSKQDLTAELMKIKLNPSFGKNNWVMQFFDRLVDKMAKVSDGKDLEALSATQHTKLVDYFTAQLKRDGETPYHHRQLAGQLHLAIKSKVQEQRARLAKVSFLFPRDKTYVSVSDWTLLLIHEWEPIQNALATLNKHGYPLLTDAQLKGDQNRPPLKKQK